MRPFSSVATLRLLFLFVTVVPASAQASVQINIKDMPEEHIRLIPASSSGFDDRLDQLLGKGTVSQEPALLAQKPFSVILNNESGRTLIGYSLRYTHVDSTGKTTTHDRFFNILDGSREAQVPPSGNAWVTPRRTMTRASTQPIPPAVRQEAIAAMDQLNRLSAITVSLDAVIYDDGSFVGPNATRAFEQATAIVGERLLVAGQFTSRQLGGASDADILTWLETLTARNPTPGADSSVDTTDWSYSCRRQYAQFLLSAYKTSGPQAAATVAKRMLSLPAIRIKR
jgi:hypothetical protein